MNFRPSVYFFCVCTGWDLSAPGENLAPGGKAGGGSGIERLPLEQRLELPAYLGIKVGLFIVTLNL